VSRTEFPRTVDELLEVMDYFDIAEALVYHSLSKDYGPAFGNARLLEEISGTDRLHAMWVVAPSHTGELPDEDELVAQMLARNVKAARVFPGTDQHNFSLKPWSCGTLLGALQSRRVPLFIDFDQTDCHTLFELCGTHDKLPIVLTGVGYRSNRLLYPLLKRFDNLHVELSSYYGHRGIEMLVERFGAGRLLFGTGLPFFSPGSAIGMLNYGRVTESDKRLIAGENLRALLGSVANR